MRIQINQQEITSAIKLYLARQGIAIAGREVTITYTSQRRENGLVADIDIDESSVDQGVDFPEPEPAAAATPVQSEDSPPAEDAPPPFASEPVNDGEPEPEAVSGAGSDEVPPKKVASLFGG